MNELERLIWNYWQKSGTDANTLARSLERIAKDIKKAEKDIQKAKKR